MRKKIVLTGGIILLIHHLSLFAQPDRWQQRVKYTMDVQMDVVTNRFTGSQTLTYTNNSPDTLDKVFYHLYWNAFQPGSITQYIILVAKNDIQKRSLLFSNDGQLMKDGNTL